MFCSIKITHFIDTGLILSCHQYGQLCYKERFMIGVSWYFHIIVFLNFTFELLNILLLCVRTRSCVNITLGKCEKENRLIIFFYL